MAKARRMILGRFLPIRKLANGRLGATWYARDVRSGAPRVVRCVESAVPGPRADAVLAEVRAAAVIDPALLVPESVEVATRLGHVVIVRAYGEGGDLATLLSRSSGAIEIGAFRLIARALLGALDALHRTGAAHGRVHARNLVLDAGPSRPRLTDAGLGRAHGTVATAVDDLSRAVALLRVIIPRSEAPTSLVEWLDQPGAAWTSASELLSTIESGLGHVVVPDEISMHRGPESGRAA